MAECDNFAGERAERESETLERLCHTRIASQLTIGRQNGLEGTNLQLAFLLGGLGSRRRRSLLAAGSLLQPARITPRK